MSKKGRGPAKEDLHRLIGAALLLCSLLALIAAVLNPGVRATQVELDDGGVWVTNARLQALAHLNPDARVLDASLKTASKETGLFQDGEQVFLTDLESASVSRVDVAHSILGSGVSNPGLGVGIGASVFALSDPEGGRVWRQDAASPAVVNPEADRPLLEGLPGVITAVGPDGTIHAASASAGLIATVKADESADEAATYAQTPFTSQNIQITGVGPLSVVLETDTGALHLPGGASVQLPGSAFALQEPGPKAKSVLVASAEALFSVPLDGGAPLRSDAPSAGGSPVRPVRLGACSYGAWTGSGAFLRDCDRDADDVALIVDTLAEATRTQFRVNRRSIVLNELESGHLWLPDEKMVLIDDWDQVNSTLKSEDEDEEDDSSERTDEIALPERSEENTPPTAVDDDFGVRAGRKNILPVLLNDIDPDGDVLTISQVGDCELGGLAITREGGAIQIDVPSQASGSASFQYTVDDGRGGTASASVTVTVHGEEINSPPEQLVAQSLSLGEGRSATINALTSWYDPDGDPFYLSGVKTPQGITARTRENGAVDLAEAGHGPGKDVVSLLVSDGREVGEGRLDLTITSGANEPPITNADHVTVRVGESATLSPAANDTDPNGDQLRVVQVEAGNSIASAVLDPARQIVAITGSAVGTTYLAYLVSDGPATTPGYIRVDVITEESAPPSAEDDIGVLPAAGQVLVDLLVNDTDPTGGVLSVQSVQTPADSPLRVALVDRRTARVTAPRGLDAPATFVYTVANGVGTATATVTIVPGPSLDTSMPPEPEDDSIVVRSGDVAGVDVLANDRSPSGLKLSLQGELQHEIPGSIATVFHSMGNVRARGGAEPGTGTILYTVADSVGNVASARVSLSVTGEDEGTNTAPHPRDLVARTSVGQPVTIPVPLDGIDDEGDSTSLVGIGSAPSQGTVEREGNGFVYTPSEEASGTDTFTYIVEDRLGKQGTGIIRVGISPRSPVNNPPIAEPVEVGVRPGTRISVPVLANVIDPDGDKVSLVPGSVIDQSGRLQVAERGDRVILTAPEEEGTHLVTYVVSDGAGGRAQGVLTVLVRSDTPLRAPIARDDAPDDEQVGEARASGSLILDVLANDEDPDGDIAEAALSSNDPGVTVLGEGKLRVDLAEQPQILVYTVTDSDGLSASAVIRVPGRQVTRPTLDLSSVPVRVRAGDSIDIPLNEHVITRDGRGVVLTDASSVSAGPGADGSALVRDMKTLSFRSTPEFSGRTSISFEVTDGAGAEDTSGRTAVLTIPIEVEALANRAPRIRPTTLRVARGQEATAVDLSEVSTDPDEADVAGLSFSIVDTAGSGLSASLAGSSLSVSASQEATLGTSGAVTVQVSDPHGESATGIFPIEVTAEGARELVRTSAARVSVDAGSSVSIDIADYATNPDPGAGPLRIVGSPSVTGGGAVSVSGTVLTITAAPQASGVITVNYTVVDASPGAKREVPGVVHATVRGLPNAPHSLRAEAVSSQTARISWRAGAANGAPITGFTVTDHTQGDTFACGVVTSCEVTGRRGGGVHEFSVTATSEVGVSEPSERVRLTMIAIPSQPGAPSVSAGDGYVEVTWRATESGAGRADSYIVTLDPGQEARVLANGQGTYSTRFAVANGVSYLARVRAVNEAGASPDSASSRPVTPFGRPGQVPGFTATSTPGADSGGTGTVELSWGAPDPNGRPIEYFTISGDGIAPFEAAGDARSASVPGVAVGQATGFTITATNDRTNPGEHTSAPASTSVTILARPQPPSISGVVASSRDGEVTMSWTPAAPSGGWNAGEYSYEWSAGGAWYALNPSNPAATVLTGLSNGTPVVISVRTVATRGDVVLYSDPVASAPVTPFGPPKAPQLSCTPSIGSVNCSWSAGATGGRPLSFYLSITGGGAEASSRAIDAEGSITFNARKGQDVSICAQVLDPQGRVVEQHCKQVKPENAQAQGVRITVNGLNGVVHYTSFSEPGKWTAHCWNGGTDLGAANGGALIDFPAQTPPEGLSFTCAGNPDDPRLTYNPAFGFTLRINDSTSTDIDSGD